MRLVEVAEREGCAHSVLVQRAAEIDWSRLENISHVGIAAGASAPEVLVDEVIAAFKERYDVTVEEISVAQERVQFKLPLSLRAPA